MYVYKLEFVLTINERHAHEPACGGFVLVRDPCWWWECGRCFQQPTLCCDSLLWCSTFFSVM